MKLLIYEMAILFFAFGEIEENVANSDFLQLVWSLPLPLRNPITVLFHVAKYFLFSLWIKFVFQVTDPPTIVDPSKFVPFLGC